MFWQISHQWTLVKNAVLTFFAIFSIPLAYLWMKKRLPKNSAQMYSSQAHERCRMLGLGWGLMLHLLIIGGLVYFLGPSWLKWIWLGIITTGNFGGILLLIQQRDPIVLKIRDSEFRESTTFYYLRADSIMGALTSFFSPIFTALFMIAGSEEKLIDAPDHCCHDYSLLGLGPEYNPKNALLAITLSFWAGGLILAMPIIFWTKAWLIVPAACVSLSIIFPIASWILEKFEQPAEVNGKA